MGINSNMNEISILMTEIKNGALDQVRKLLRRNSNIINEYLYGVTPLLYSIECKREDLALELCNLDNVDVALKDNLDVGPLERAVELKLYRVVESLAKKTKKSQLNNFLAASTETYLTSCLKSDDQNVAISLIRGGADVNRPNKQNETPIQLAIRYSKMDALKEMLKRDDIYLGTSELEGKKYNPLLDACERDLTQVALLLIENGADVNKHDADERKWNPLMHSICNNNETLVIKFMEKKADLAHVDDDGNSALHLAVLADNDFILSLLLRANPDRSVRNGENLTPLELAKLNESDDCVKLLT